MAPKSRAENRAEQTRAILDRARAQLAEVGPAALSVRQIARDVGMVSSAVYRYFPSRDELLTALIIETYDELGDAVEAAESSVADRADLAARFAAICHAIRDWARANPHEYALLYGSPVPGYVAPDDTVTPAIRVSGAFLALAQAAEHAGVSTITTTPVSPAEKAALVPIQEFLDGPVDAAHLVRWLMAWSTVFGHTSLELFGHMHRGILDYDAHFRQVSGQLAADLGLTS
ncbi:TetR family transcriptional regulator [Nocardioides sp. Root1257]|uniref:TetR/AcrR family transcriptional regulator n=1 Tax=unclassified Nocardioides TaxID=2615069 RepID=UPI0006F820FB|nr:MULTISPECIES: TetR/AcrR family transcriptional regulator [unclassified Nocardioides]KQW53260.1 TetR family transcriptional regulator [Nocardioides sp. Root1257]KRC55946.1 TetR family transcriptional regulator [Nocardioides sp. Root224]